MKIISIEPNGFASNTYVLVSGSSALVIDPSASVETILDTVKNEGVALQGILLTHGHFDHTLSLDTLRQAQGITAAIHKDDAIMLTDGKKNAYYDFYGKESFYAPADILLNDKDKIAIGDEEITVIHTPGHSKGSVCFLCGDFLVTGDTLFSEGYGRYDLWGGDRVSLFSSLKKLRGLPQDMTIYPGHGFSERLGNALDVVAYLL